VVSVLQKLRDLAVGFRANPDPFIEDTPTLVMIHGAGGNSQVWQNQIDFLNSSFNTLALDLPGHGDSKDSAKDMITDYTQWLVELLAILFREPIWAMGHSMGGAIIQDLAILYPQLLNGIILVSTGSHFPVDPMLLEGVKSNFDKATETFIGYAYALETERALVKEGERLWKEAGPKVVYDDLLACSRFDRNGDLKKINLPCLIIGGDKDILTPRKILEGLNKSIEDSDLVFIPSAGHTVMIENYTAFNQHVRDFVSKTIE
jgi:pimeloyl-ACP methyl ester carboxylesterase